MIPVPVMFTDSRGVRLLEPVGKGRETVVTKLEGWFGGVTIRNNHVERLGDGLFAADMRRGGRKLTLGVFEKYDSERAVLERARQISGAYRSGEPGNGVLSVTTDFTGELSAIGVALDGEPRIVHDLDRLIVQWELPLVCPDPALHGPLQETAAFTPNLGAGLEFVLFDDDDGPVTTGVLEFGDQPPAAATLVNAGNAPAFPVVTVVGEMTSGFRLRLTGDKDRPGPWGVTWASAVRADSGPVVVDMSGAITVGGVDQSWAATQRDWGGVEPGGVCSVSIEPLAGGWGEARLQLRSAWI